jgi:uncharacterized repeat protein (TIGR01451 family)
MLSTKKFPRIFPESKFLKVFAVLFFIFLFYIYFFQVSHPPTLGPFYKEYSSINELYKNAALGDRAKVTITISNPTPNKAGAIQVADTNSAGVVFKIPLTQLNNIKLLPGRNIVFCRVVERVGASIVCEIEEVKI